MPDNYQLSDVNGGVTAMAAALSMEQGGGTWYKNIDRMVTMVTEWANGTQRNGGPVIEESRALTGLAGAETHARVAQALSARSAWTSINKLPDAAFGPASKVFSTESYISTAEDLISLAAPQSLMRGREGLN